MKGKVFLVGAGPGDPELLTLKALRVLRAADVVLHDELVGPEILKLTPPTAILHNVGKRCGHKNVSQEEINSLMVNMAGAGLAVIRLKGGDPLIFGRAGEEIDALRRAQIDFEIVPGITAALGAAAAARIPLTDRRSACKIVLATGHRAFGKSFDPAVEQISSGSTLVLYMPGDDYSSVSTQLQHAGLSAETPCVLVSQATAEMQQVHRTTVAALRNHPPLPAPALLIVGAVAESAVASIPQPQNDASLVNCWAQP